MTTIRFFPPRYADVSRTDSQKPLPFMSYSGRSEVQKKTGCVQNNYKAIQPELQTYLVRVSAQIQSFQQSNNATGVLAFVEDLAGIELNIPAATLPPAFKEVICGARAVVVSILATKTPVDFPGLVRQVREINALKNAFSSNQTIQNYFGSVKNLLLSLVQDQHENLKLDLLRQVWNSVEDRCTWLSALMAAFPDIEQTVLTVFSSVDESVETLGDLFKIYAKNVQDRVSWLGIQIALNTAVALTSLCTRFLSRQRIKNTWQSAQDSLIIVHSNTYQMIKNAGSDLLQYFLTDDNVARVSLSALVLFQQFKIPQAQQIVQAFQDSITGSAASQLDVILNTIELDFTVNSLSSATWTNITRVKSISLLTPSLTTTAVRRLNVSINRLGSVALDLTNREEWVTFLIHCTFIFALSGVMESFTGPSTSVGDFSSQVAQKIENNSRKFTVAVSSIAQCLSSDLERRAFYNTFSLYYMEAATICSANTSLFKMTRNAFLELVAMFEKTSLDLYSEIREKSAQGPDRKLEALEAFFKTIILKEQILFGRFFVANYLALSKIESYCASALQVVSTNIPQPSFMITANFDTVATVWGAAKYNSAAAQNFLGLNKDFSYSFQQLYRLRNEAVRAGDLPTALSLWDQMRLMNYIVGNVLFSDLKTTLKEWFEGWMIIVQTEARQFFDAILQAINRQDSAETQTQYDKLLVWNTLYPNNLLIRNYRLLADKARGIS